MFAVLLISEFGLQAVLRTEPDGGNRPAALFSDQTKKSVVLMTNALAREAGVEIGMTAPQAVARCPALTIRPPKPAAEAEARATLLAVGFSLSPSIEDTAPGVCTIDLKGTDPAENEANATAAVRRLEGLGFFATAGIGGTPLLALYGARFVASGTGAASAPADEPQTAFAFAVAESPPRPAPGSTPPAKRPTVFTVTNPDSFLRPLPLLSADPLPETARVLTSWGVRTLGELTALSRDDIGRRLGPTGLQLWDRAKGGTSRPLHPVAPPQTFTAGIEFEDEIETLEPLLFTLRRFLERLALELSTSGYVAAAIDLMLQLTNETIHERSFRLPEPTADVDTLFRVLHTHLETLRTEATIVGVQLRIAPARPLVRQQGLFDTGLRDPHGFAETLARIGAIVGSDRVGTPQREDTHRPDAVKLSPPPPVIPPPAEPPVHPPLSLPLRRYRPPLRAQLELTDGKPTYLWTEQFNGAIADVRGPWLSSGEWWQSDRIWRRTEYDIALATGGLYRLVLSDRSWFVEGEYD